MLPFCIFTAVNCEDEVETRFEKIYSFAKRNPDIARQFFDAHNFKRQASDASTSSIERRSVGQENSYIELLESLKHKLHNNPEFKSDGTLNWFKQNNNLRIRDISNGTVSSATNGINVNGNNVFSAGLHVMSVFYANGYFVNQK